MFMTLEIVIRISYGMEYEQRNEWVIRCEIWIYLLPAAVKT